MGKSNRWSVLTGTVCLLLSGAVLAASHPPALERPFNPLAKIQQAALFDNGDEWLVRGRVTRTDNERWVPHGQIVAEVDGQMFSGAYRPLHIEPKARRASWFSIRIPKQALSGVSDTIRLQYQAR